MPRQHVRSPILSSTPASAAPLRAKAGPVAIALALLGATAILFCEAVTPLALSMGCLYMLLATYAAMRLDEIAMICLLVATNLGGMLMHHLQPIGAGPAVGGFSPAEIWNSATRLVTVCLFGVVLRRLLLLLRGERQRAERDPLTGAFNRRALYERFDALRPRAGWQAPICGVVFLDLDAFKAANDRFGHAAGDALLARLAFAASGALDEDDLFARIGGDEFVALVVGEDERAIEQRIYAFHTKLALMLVDMQLGVTCSSGGVIARIGRDETLDALILRADRLMYEVKEGGKDGVRIVYRGSAEPLIDPAYPRRACVREENRNTA